MMINNRLITILSYLDELFPHARCELNYQKDYQLVIAVMLSAQTTDISVNRVTKKLFSNYTNIESLANANVEDIALIIKSLGLYQIKALNIVKIATALLKDFNGKVPADKKSLLELPGVGNKTANVIRAELFKIPEIAVDTHVARVSKRLDLAKVNDSPLVIENKLKKLLNENRYIKTHHQMIHFGRYKCKAKKPLCYDCKLVDICCEKNKNFSD
jgi:endonuclease III